jgi:hypothetical protein
VNEIVENAARNKSAHNAQLRTRMNEKKTYIVVETRKSGSSASLGRPARFPLIDNCWCMAAPESSDLPADCR